MKLFQSGLSGLLVLFCSLLVLAFGYRILLFSHLDFYSMFKEEGLVGTTDILIICCSGYVIYANVLYIIRKPKKHYWIHFVGFLIVGILLFLLFDYSNSTWVGKG